MEWKLVFINVYDGGQSCTEDEYRGRLTEAGFEDLCSDHEECVITARKRAV